MKKKFATLLLLITLGTTMAYAWPPNSSKRYRVGLDAFIGTCYGDAIDRVSEPAVGTYADTNVPFSFGLGIPVQYMLSKYFYVGAELKWIWNVCSQTETVYSPNYTTYDNGYYTKTYYSDYDEYNDTGNNYMLEIPVVLGIKPIDWVYVNVGPTYGYSITNEFSHWGFFGEVGIELADMLQFGVSRSFYQYDNMRGTLLFNCRLML